MSRLHAARTLSLVAAFMLVAQLALPWVIEIGQPVTGFDLGTGAFAGRPVNGYPAVIGVLFALSGTVAAAASFLTRPARFAGPIGLWVSSLTTAIVVPTMAVFAGQQIPPSDAFANLLVAAPAWCMAAAFLLFVAAAITPPESDSPPIVVLDVVAAPSATVEVRD